MPVGRPRKYASEDEKRKVVIQRAIEWRRNFQPLWHEDNIKKSNKIL